MLALNEIKIFSYKKAIFIIVNLLVFIMLLTLIGATIGLFVDFFDAFKTLSNAVPNNPVNVPHTLINKLIHTLVVDILSVFILIELFRTFTDYLQINRIRLTVLAEFGFIFVLRDIFIGLYVHKVTGMELISLSIVLAVLAGTRILAGVFPAKEDGHKRQLTASDNQLEAEIDREPAKPMSNPDNFPVLDPSD